MVDTNFGVVVVVDVLFNFFSSVTRKIMATGMFCLRRQQRHRRLDGAAVAVVVLVLLVGLVAGLSSSSSSTSFVVDVTAFSIVNSIRIRRRRRRVPLLPRYPRSSSTTLPVGGSQSCTALQVSELHVPGYTQTKVPFIHPDEPCRGGGGGGSNEGGRSTAIPLSSSSSSTTTIFRERTYQPNVDYISLVPHKNGHLIHKTTIPIFTIQECESIVDEAEEKAKEMGWTTTRHGNYPTTDLPIVELPKTLEFLRVALVERIYPLLRQQFGELLPDGGKNLRVADGFIVKYDAEGGQTELKPHRDGSVLSFNIALNPISAFEGGGTWFHSLDDPLKIDQGQIVSHSSSLLHGGHGITWGKRYIIVCFVILEGYDSWSMRFYNQVRNL